MTKFVIQDWAGNMLFDGKTFESFEDGWEFIYNQFPDEEDLSDYYVLGEEYYSYYRGEKS